MKTTTIKLFTYSLLALAIIPGCKKKTEDKPSEINTCVQDNYGVLTVKFTDAAVKHGIIVTFSNSSSRNKIVAKGKMSDTLHLPPGSYHVNIASVNDMDQAIKDETYNNRQVVQCGDMLIEVNF